MEAIYRRIGSESPRAIAGLLTLAFIVVSYAYITLSDMAALYLSEGEPGFLTTIQSLKGVLYVSLVGAFVFLACHEALRAVRAAACDLQEAREALLDTRANVMSAALASAVAHDARNLAGAIHGNVEYVRVGSAEHLPDDYAEAIADIEEAARVLVDLLGAVKLRGTPTEFSDEDLDAILRRMVRLMASHSALSGRNIRYEHDTGELHAEIDRPLIAQSIVNLILNAAHATDDAGEILVRLADRNGSVQIEVHDDGCGFSDGTIDELKEAFVSEKARGSGLGLYSVNHCMEIHEGELELGESELLSGARAALLLPKSQVS